MPAVGELTTGNREEWLIKATKALEARYFNKPAKALPKKLALSCGIPKGSVRAIGQCWDPKVTKDGTTHIFICPSMDDPVQILGVLIHELCHACLGLQEGHGKKFKQMVREFGLKGKVTSTFVEEGSKLEEELKELLEELGEYPHKALNKVGFKLKKPRKRTSIKLQSVVEPSYVISMKISLYEEHGAPKCPFDETMVEKDEDN